MSSEKSAPKNSIPSIKIPEDELQFTFVRSSGAGGQNVNKVSSKAVLRWNARASRILTGGMRERFMQKFGSKLTVEGDILITSDRYRDQGRNAADCMAKLREMIAAIAKPPKKRIPTKPTLGSKLRRLKAKRAHSEKKRDRRYRGD